MRRSKRRKILYNEGVSICAQVAELADALDSGSSGRKVVEVRVLSWAPFILKCLCRSCSLVVCWVRLPGASCGVSSLDGELLYSLVKFGLA